jgi:small subunit ribosomal protein S1
MLTDVNYLWSQTNYSNPWDQYEGSFAVGTVHTGEIAEIVDKGATVEFGEDIVAFIPTRHLEKKTVRN